MRSYDAHMMKTTIFLPPLLSLIDQVTHESALSIWDLTINIIWVINLGSKQSRSEQRTEYYYISGTLRHSERGVGRPLSSSYTIMWRVIKIRNAYLLEGVLLCIIHVDVTLDMIERKMAIGLHNCPVAQCYIFDNFWPNCLF